MQKCFQLTTLTVLLLAFSLHAHGQTRSNPQPDTQENWYQGKEMSIYSEALNENRSFRVGLPPSYESDTRRYPVVYVLDGQHYYFAAAGAIRTLSSLSLMPEAILVAIYNPDRQKDMSPPDMQIESIRKKNGDNFLQFLEAELIPYIDSQYRTLPLRVLFGHSHGAIFNLYTLKKAPSLFRFHIALDAPVHLDKAYLERGLKEMLQNNPEHAGRLVVGWSRYDWSKEQKGFLSKNKSDRFQVMEIDMAGETHQSMYYPGIYQGLKSLFSDHEYRHVKTLTFEALQQRYKSMNAAYGYEIPIPIWALRYGALDHLVAADANAARPFVEALERLYKNANIMDDNAREWLNELEANPPSESRAQFLARPDAQPQEIKSFLGKWRGGPYEIDIRLEQGKPAVTIIQTFFNGEKQIIDASKITILENERLSLSYENMMPPRTGLLYFELSPVQGNKSQLKHGFKVYWPRLESRNQPNYIELTRD